MPRPSAKCQRQLFEEPHVVPGVLLPLDVQQQLRQALAQWMLTLSKMIRKEDDDE